MSSSPQANDNLIPNFTQIPNALLDHMAEIDPYRLKVLLFVARKTYGWQKRQDRISLSQLELGTGLSRSCVSDCLKALCNTGLLLRERSEKGNLWSLNLEAKWSARTTGSPGLPTKETITKETIQKKKTCDPPDRGQTSSLPGFLVEDQKPSNGNVPSEEEKPGTALAVVKPRTKADPRHFPCRKLLEEYWQQANPNTPDLPWEGRDAKALSEFLSANPRLDGMQFRGLLQNRARSDVAHGDRVYRWIGNLTQYQEPLNQYNRPARTTGEKEMAITLSANNRSLSTRQGPSSNTSKIAIELGMLATSFNEALSKERLAIMAQDLEESEIPLSFVLSAICGWRDGALVCARRCSSESDRLLPRKEGTIDPADARFFPKTPQLRLLADELFDVIWKKARPDALEQMQVERCDSSESLAAKAGAQREVVQSTAMDSVEHWRAVRLLELIDQTTARLDRERQERAAIAEAREYCLTHPPDDEGYRRYWDVLKEHSGIAIDGIVEPAELARKRSWDDWFNQLQTERESLRSRERRIAAQIAQLIAEARRVYATAPAGSDDRYSAEFFLSVHGGHEDVDTRPALEGQEYKAVLQ